MIGKGDKVKIDFTVLDFPEAILKPMREFDKEHDGIHIVSNVYIKGAYTGNEVRRIELDNEFVFYENELIEVE